MLPTLFHIPHHVAGLPVFGFGLLLALWAVVGLLILGWLVRRQGWNADTWSNVPLLVVIGAAIWLLLPHLTDAEGLPIRGYGVMVLLGTVLAVALAVRRGQQRDVSSDVILAMVFWMFLPGIVGARLFYVIEYWHRDFLRDTFWGTFVAVINLTEGGLVVYGSLLGGFAGLVAYLVKYRLPWLATFDLFAPTVMLGMALGRIGCMLNGCCFGGPCDLPWAVHFPAGSPVHIRQIEKGQVFLEGLKIVGDPDAPPVITAVQPGSPAEQAGLRKGQTIVTLHGERTLPRQATENQADWDRVLSVEHAQQALLAAGRQGNQVWVRTAGVAKEAAFALTPLGESEPVHPTQIYSAINALLLCLFLLAIDPFCRRDGELFAWLLTLYPITRFIIEAIRIDEPAIWGTGMSIAQNVSLLLLVAAFGVWAYVLHRPVGKVPFPASVAA